MMLQGTPEWLAAKLGKVGASRVSDITAKTKSGWSTSRANYMAELIAERLTGVPAEKFKSQAMEWGTDTEASARAAYAFMTDATVALAGFVDHPTVPMSGASPDGFVGDDGLLELKCPLTSTHIDTLLGGSVPGKYIAQMQWQMSSTGRAWCDFASFDPRLPEAMRLFIKRVPRDDVFIAELESQVRQFLSEIDEKIAALSNRYDIRRAG